MFNSSTYPIIYFKFSDFQIKHKPRFHTPFLINYRKRFQTPKKLYKFDYGEVLGAEMRYNKEE